MLTSSERGPDIIRPFIFVSGKEVLSDNAWLQQLTEARISSMGSTSGKAAATGSATLAAFLTLLISFFVFRWGLIRLWEWQHEGRRMMFVIGPEINAAILALLSSSIVFVVVFRRSPHSKR